MNDIVDIPRSLNEALPSEMVIEICDFVAYSYKSGKARWAQRLILGAVCKRWRVEYQPTFKHKSIKVMDELLRYPSQHTQQYRDLWMVSFRCGAVIDPVETLKYTMRIRELHHVTKMVSQTHVLTIKDLNDIFIYRLDDYPEGLIEIWKHQNIPSSFFEERFTRMKNQKLYGYIKNLYPDKRIGLLTMVSRGIPEAIRPYYGDIDLRDIPFQYLKTTASPSFSILEKFMGVCDVKLSCKDIQKLLRLISVKQFAFVNRTNGTHAEKLSHCLYTLSPHIKCDGCPSDFCYNYVIINNFSFESKDIVRELNTKSKCYKVIYSAPMNDTIVDPLELLTTVTSIDDMFAFKDIYDNGVLHHEFIKKHIRLIEKTKHCRRWYESRILTRR
jgi:hypothetical protein